MRKYEHDFKNFLLFICPVVIALFLYSFREGMICREFRINPILEEIYYEIEYLSDTELHSVYDYWQYPEETIKTARGDCEDVAMVLAKRITDMTGLPAWIVTGDGREVTHAWVLFKNYYYDPTFKRTLKPERYQSEFRNIDYMSYEKAMQRCSEDAVQYF